MSSHQRLLVVKSLEITGKSHRRGEATRNNRVLGIMTVIVQPRAVATPKRSQARFPGQRVEGPANAPAIQSCSTVGDEHEIRTAWAEELLASLQRIDEYGASYSGKQHAQDRIEGSEPPARVERPQLLSRLGRTCPLAIRHRHQTRVVTQTRDGFWRHGSLDTRQILG
jgi:hypothetical protein